MSPGNAAKRSNERVNAFGLSRSHDLYAIRDTDRAREMERTRGPLKRTLPGPVYGSVGSAKNAIVPRRWRDETRLVFAHRNRLARGIRDVVSPFLPYL